MVVGEDIVESAQIRDIRDDEHYPTAVPTPNDRDSHNVARHTGVTPPRTETLEPSSW